MGFNDETKRMFFIMFYTIVTTLLVLNTINSKLLVDMFYTAIFVCIYLKYLYVTVSN